jgi:hypothetical protein
LCRKWNANCTLAQLRVAGFPADAIKEVSPKLTPQQLVEAGFPLKGTGFSFSELKGAGFSARQMMDPSNPSHPFHPSHPSHPFHPSHAGVEDDEIVAAYKIFLAENDEVLSTRRRSSSPPPGGYYVRDDSIPRRLVEAWD